MGDELTFSEKCKQYLAERWREICRRIRSEFTSGQNIYIVNFFDFSLGMLILFGERGRVDFLDGIGKELDRTNAVIAHRRMWSNLLKTV